MTVAVRFIKKPELQQPKLISGLPGSGLVAKLAVDHLVRELKAELFGFAYSYALPPQVYIKPTGSADLMKHELYYCKNSDYSNDFIFYTGDAQPLTPEAEYEMADKVLEVALDFGAKTVYSLAAFITGQFVEVPKVFGTVTDEQLLKDLEKYGVQLMFEGSITGMNGLLIGLAKVKGMMGTCLLGETSGYIVDAKASQAVLGVLTKMLGITVDMKSLEERAKQDEDLVKQLDAMRHRSFEKPKPDDKELGYIS